MLTHLLSPILKRIILASTPLLFAFSAFAQSAGTVQKSITITLDRSLDQRQSLPKVLIVINDRPLVDQQIQTLVDKNDVIDISILNGVNAEAKYGLAGKNGALSIFVKPKLKFIGLAQLLTKFKIEPKDQLLDVYVNNEKIMFTSAFFVASKWVKSVKVVHAPNSESNASHYIVLSK